MFRLISMCVSLLWVLNSFSQEFNTHWISMSETDDSSQVWFRQTFLSSKRPRQASLTITSRGRFQTYINERNVSTDVLLPSDGNSSDGIVSFTIDITRFLRTDSNTVAIWYAPADSLFPNKQISIIYYGIDADGKRFAHFSDGTWLCKKAPGWNKGDAEGFDNREYDRDWKKVTADLSGWNWACGEIDRHIFSLQEKSSYYNSFKRFHTYYPETSAEVEDTIVCNFPKHFSGWIRLTIRNAKAGNIINIGSFKYICSGETDEQACRRFSTDSLKEIIITGDNLKSSQLQNIEGIEILPYWHNRYMY